MRDFALAAQIPKAQECDASDDAISTISWYHKNQSSYAELTLNYSANQPLLLPFIKEFLYLKCMY